MKRRLYLAELWGLNGIIVVKSKACGWYDVSARDYWCFFQILTSLWILLVFNTDTNYTYLLKSYSAPDALPGIVGCGRGGGRGDKGPESLRKNSKCHEEGDVALTGSPCSRFSCPQPTPLWILHLHPPCETPEAESPVHERNSPEQPVQKARWVQSILGRWVGP